MLVAGRIIDMIVMIVAIVAVYWFTKASERGAIVPLRPIPALEAVNEAVGRAAEMGRPITFTTGYSAGGFKNPSMGPGCIAAVSVLGEVARVSAKQGVQILVALSQDESIPLVSDILKSAYAVEGLSVPPDSIRFFSGWQFAYAASVMKLMLEERPAANFLMGYFWAESLMMAECGNYVGAMQIAGSTSIGQLPFLIATCDYCLIGEELFAARGYLEKDVSTLGALRTQDLVREISIAIILLVWLGGNFGLQWLIELLSM